MENCAPFRTRRRCACHFLKQNDTENANFRFRAWPCVAGEEPAGIANAKKAVRIIMREDIINPCGFEDDVIQQTVHESAKFGGTAFELVGCIAAERTI
jgi:hypothetical protein